MTSKATEREVNESVDSLMTINSAVQKVSYETDVLKEVIKQLMKDYDYSLEDVVDNFMSSIEDDIRSIREYMEDTVELMKEEA